MERSISSPHFSPLSKAKGSRRNLRNEAVDYQEIRLSFDTQRVQRAKTPEPVESILLNATYTQEMSYQPTLPVSLKSVDPEIYFENTLATRVGRMDFRKTQAIMLFTISTMGLIIGILISFIL